MSLYTVYILKSFLIIFREGHGRGEYEDHTASAYKPPRKPP